MFSKFFIDRPRFATVISLLIIITGLLTVFQLPIAEYPEISPPQINVSTSYSGASAEVLRDTVALVLESELNGIDNLLYFSSECSNTGSYSCTLTFKTGTDQDIAMVEVQNAVKRSEAKLPSEVQQMGINVEKRSGDILAMFQLQTDGKNMSEMELDNYASTTLSDALSRVDGVASSDVFGGLTYSMRIWLDPIRTQSFNVGKASSLERTDAQVSHTSAQADVVTAKYDYQDALATISYLIGEVSDIAEEAL